MKSIRFIAFLFLFFMILPCPAGAQTIAVFPLLDMTRDANGTNMELTGYLRRQTELRGFNVVADKDVMAFMVRHRIRNLGRLDTLDILRANKEVGADMILLGTICQLHPAPSATVSLSLQLIRTSDAQTVWTTTRDLNQSDLLTLLALSDAENLNDLFEVYFPKLVQALPDTIETNVKGEQRMIIDSIVLTPKNVQPGHRVHCSVRLATIGQSGEEGAQREVSIRIGDLTYPADLDEEENRVTASWLAQEKEGVYRVALIVKQSSGNNDSTVLGEYQVDGTPPVVNITLIGREIDGQTMFSKSLTIMTRMPEPELIRRWTVAAYNTDNEPIVYQEAEGQLAQRITWKGYTSSGIKAIDGEYLIRVKVWDLAGLSASAEQRVVLRRGAPKVSLNVTKRDDQFTIAMDNHEPTPLLFWWLRIFQDGGRIVKSEDGDTFPAAVTFELPEDAGSSKFEVLLEVQDILGNKSRRKFKNLAALTVKKQEQDIDTERQWLEDF